MSNVPGKNSRLEEMNRFRSVLRHRLRCLEASLAKRLFLTSEAKVLQELRPHKPIAELLLIARDTALVRTPPDRITDQYALAVVTQLDDAATRVPQFRLWDAHMQAFISPTCVLGADRCHMLLSRIAHDAPIDLATMERWGSLSMSLEKTDHDAIREWIKGYARQFRLPTRLAKGIFTFIDHAEDVFQKLTNLVLISDGNMITLVCNGSGDFRSNDILRRFERGVGSLTAQSVALSRTDGQTGQLAYTIPVVAIPEGVGPRGPSSIFVVTSLLDLAQGDVRPHGLKEAG